MLWHSIFLAVLVIVMCEGYLKQVRKCCGDSELLSLDFYQCREDDFAVEWKTEFQQQLLLDNLTLTESYGFPRCNNEDVFLNKQLGEVNRTILEQFTDICVDIAVNHSKIIVACVPNTIASIISDKSSIRKCCRMFDMMVQGIGQCNSTDQDFKPEFYNLIDNNVTSKLDLFTKDVNIVSPGCRNKVMLNDEEGWVLGNGSLYYVPDGDIIDRDDFCVDNVIGLPGVYLFTCTINRAIYDGTTIYASEIEYLLITVGLIISITFLTATFLIYAAGWKKQNSYGRSLVCHLASMILAYICLAALQLQPYGFPIPNGLCDLIAYIMLLAFLSAFFWMNIMCFDIWRTFRNIRPRDSLQRGPKILRFFFYSLYGWGMPVLLTLITMTVSSYQLLPPFLLPEIKHCWLSRDTYGYHLFFIAPISAIILCNAVLYVITAWKCYQVKKDIRKRTKNDKQREANFFQKRKQLILNVKLFIVMGITWSMEVVSFLFKNELREYTPAYMWYITDAINALYGLSIFLIFAIKKKNIIKITRRISLWAGKYRSGSENLSELRKISTTVVSSTIDTSLGETG